MEEEEGQRLSH